MTRRQGGASSYVCPRAPNTLAMPLVLTEALATAENRQIVNLINLRIEMNVFYGYECIQSCSVLTACRAHYERTAEYVAIRLNLLSILSTYISTRFS